MMGRAGGAALLRRPTSGTKSTSEWSISSPTSRSRALERASNGRGGDAERPPGLGGLSRFGGGGGSRTRVGGFPTGLVRGQKVALTWANTIPVSIRP